MQELKGLAKQDLLTIMKTLLSQPDRLHWIRMILGIPHVEWTSFKPKEKKKWVTVSFKRPFSEPPTVVACCEGYTYIPYSMPPLPRWTRPDFRETYGRSLRDAFIRVAGDWYWLNWLRDRFADIFYAIGYVIGSLTNWFFDTVIKPAADDWADRVERTVRDTIKDIHENLLGFTARLGASPIPVRNVTRDKCEVYVPETCTIHVIAVGEF